MEKPGLGRKKYFTFGNLIKMLSFSFISKQILFFFLTHHIDFPFMKLYKTEPSPQKPVIIKHNYYNSQKYS